MALTPQDLEAISELITKALDPIKADLQKIKDDVGFLARLNQLDAIRGDSRLKILYGKHDQEEA